MFMLKKRVVEEIEDESSEILLEEAREISPRYSLGDIAEIEVTPRQFGRVAAQSAKASCYTKELKKQKEISYIMNL